MQAIDAIGYIPPIPLSKSLKFRTLRRLKLFDIEISNLILKNKLFTLKPTVNDLEIAMIDL